MHHIQHSMLFAKALVDNIFMTISIPSTKLKYLKLYEDKRVIACKGIEKEWNITELFLIQEYFFLISGNSSRNFFLVS